MERGKVQEVFGRRAGGYVNSVSHADREVLRSVEEMCGPLDGRSLLDVATGTGHTALHLAGSARLVAGLDITPQMLELARDAGRDRGLKNVRWLRGDVRSMPFPDGTFDVLTCRRAPHHFPDLDLALKEMARVLRPGGVMVIDDRSVPDDVEVADTMNLLDLLHDPSHVREYSAREWREALLRAGLHLEKVREYRRHLPLTTLTWNAEPEDAIEIERVVASLPGTLRERMSVEEVDGQLLMDQYYVTLRATK